MTQRWWIRLGVARLSADYAFCRLQGLLEGRQGVRPEVACAIWLRARFRAQQTGDAVIHAALSGAFTVRGKRTQGVDSEFRREQTVFPAIERALEPLRREALLAAQLFLWRAVPPILDPEWVLDRVFPLLESDFDEGRDGGSAFDISTVSAEPGSRGDLFDAFGARLDLRGAALSFLSLLRDATIKTQAAERLRSISLRLRESDEQAARFVTANASARSAARRASAVERSIVVVEPAVRDSSDGIPFREVRARMGLVHEPLRRNDLPWSTKQNQGVGRAWV
jgi:hypothetical protein